MRELSLFLLLMLLFSSCSTRGKGAYNHERSLLQKTIPANPEEKIFTPDNKTAISLALYEEYEKWKGTPYKYGGVNKSGVDCSSFVQSMYYNALRVQVPRTTSLQEKYGDFINKKELREGDMIIFHTGQITKHSGIYIEKGKFAHVSSKHGVTISNVNNPYWKQKYSQSRRVIHY